MAIQSTGDKREGGLNVMICEPETCRLLVQESHSRSRVIGRTVTAVNKPYDPFTLHIVQ